MTRGERNAAWIEAMCRVPEGRLVGRPVKLRSWQVDILRGIYDQSTRRAIISFGRKNGKTALSAFLLLLHLCGPEAKANSQLFSAAQSRDQAAVLFALAAKTVRMSPDLVAFVGVRDTAKQLFCSELGTLYRALSADASTAYGLSPVFVVHDELGQVKGPRSELYEALETASGAQEEPLSIIISTQAPTDADLLSVLIDDAKSGADPRTRLFLYTADGELDPFSREAQAAANPALGDFLNETEVTEQAAAAKRMPSSEAGYRNLILNQRTTRHEQFIARQVWKENAGPLDLDVFKRCPVFLGIDLSARGDLTAIARVAQDEQKVWHWHVDFFVPEVGLQERSHRDRAPYDMWVSQQFMRTTPGASIDYESVASLLAQVASDYHVAGAAFDRWGIDNLKSAMARLGVELEMQPFGQGFKDMTPALQATEAELVNGRVRHGNHPVLSWCASNTIVHADHAGNRKLDKLKSTGRIDGLVAIVMAMGIATRHTDEAAPTFQAFSFGGPAPKKEAA